MKMTINILWKALSIIVLTTSFINGASGQETVQPKIVPLGESKSTTTKILETGSKLLQGNSPIKGFDIYLVGLHPMKKHPELQIEAHHYCHQMNEDFAQCVLFDSNTKDANMNGIEYIISEKIFNSLPTEEKKYWHPHNGEILTGQLVAPGIPKIAEHELMKNKMNSYGKTWHIWNTGYEGYPPDDLPLGEPMLAWSFNRYGEVIPSLVEKRDKKMNINIEEIYKDRMDLQPLAKPQSGVDDLKGRFGLSTKDIPGVIDVREADKPGTTAP